MKDGIGIPTGRGIDLEPLANLIAEKLRGVALVPAPPIPPILVVALVRAAVRHLPACYGTGCDLRATYWAYDRNDGSTKNYFCDAHARLGDPGVWMPGEPRELREAPLARAAATWLRETEALGLAT